MKEFIESLFKNNNIVEFTYEKYNTLFVREKFDSYYLFFFLNKEEELHNLKNKSGDIYTYIKNMDKDHYSLNMDKNTTCIFCLCMDDDRYYKVEDGRSVDELIKLQCAIEEDLIYFKKNVFLYSNQMNEYANNHIGGFDEICKEQLIDETFQNYKASKKDNYKYEFLINLFVKLPFLDFYNCQNSNVKVFKSAMDCIHDICAKESLDITNIQSNISELEDNMKDEESLYLWLDKLIENENKMEEAEINENTEFGNK